MVHLKKVPRIRLCFFLKYVFYSLQCGKLKKVSPKKFIEALNWQKIGTQDDVHEFFQFLKTKLGECIDDGSKHRLVELFAIRLKSSIMCTHTDFFSDKRDQFFVLTLAISDHSNIIDAFRSIVIIQLP